MAAFILALCWVFLVPIFQGPDEPAHFDYAMSLATEGGLLRAKDGRTVPLAHPDVQYLAWATAALPMVFTEARHVPATYGTEAYFESINRDAPVVGRAFFALPDHPLPYVIVQYPFGFYALEGAAIALLTPQSEVTTRFFAARIVCTLLLVTGLIFSYLTFRELKLGAVRAVLLTGIIGCLPLSTFVGSYVQPDNLAFALICVIFYFCLRARRAADSALWLGRLGVALGLLLATKFQFFLAVAPPVLATVVWSRAPFDKGRTVRLKQAALLLAPSAVLGAIVLWVMREPRAAYLAGYYSDWDQPSPCRLLPDAVAKIGCFGQWSANAFDAYFGNGYSARSFWGTYGWGNTVVIGSSQIESVVRSVTVYATWAVLAGVAIVLARRATTIVRLSISGRWIAALRVLFCDPILNAYVAFALLMFVLYVTTGNLGGTYGVQGRYWFPLLLPMVLAATTIAPLALRRRRFVRIASGFMVALLASYALAGSYFAAADVKQRYYDPPPLVLRLGAQKWDGETAAGTIENASQFMAEAGTSAKLSASLPIIVSGWAIDKLRGGPGLGVQIDVDGRALFPAFYGAPRADVAAAYGEQFAGSSYQAVLEAGTLKPGRHIIRARMITRDIGFYERLPSSITVELAP